MRYQMIERLEGKNPRFNSKVENKIKTKFGAKPNILVVEDNFVIQKVTAGQLERFGCDYDIAENGVTALKLFNKNSYDLILLDIGLPDMNGIDICKRIRAVSHSEVPIIAVTAFGEAVHDGCLEAGFDDFYVKPVDIKVLRATLVKHIC